MFKILILVCSASIAAADCNRHNASDTVRGPMVSSARQCVFEGLMMVAPTKLVSATGHEYPKIVCERVVEAYR